MAALLSSDESLKQGRNRSWLLYFHLMSPLSKDETGHGCSSQLI
jgi:hypothetical protein